MLVAPLVLLSPWFGAWPVWINFHLLSCAHNPDITWLVPTDQEPPEYQPPNVRFMRMSLPEFSARVSDTTGVRFAPTRAYKVCDIRPMLGDIFRDDIAGFHSWGYSDMDVIWGNLRAVYTDELLARYVAISAHDSILSGHLSVFLNTESLRRAYRRRRSWRHAVGSPAHIGFDEGEFSHVFQTSGLLAKPFVMRHSLFVERYSTVDCPRPWHDGRAVHPRLWHWRNGTLTNTDDGDRQFLYLHFMTWKADFNRRAAADRASGSVAAEAVLQVDWRDAEDEGFQVSPAGFALIGG